MSDVDILKERKCEFKASSSEPFGVATIGGNTIRFDEGEDIPGSDSAQEYPSPVDYLVSSLIGCQVSVLEQALHLADIDEFEIHASGHIEEVSQDEIPDGMPAHTAARIDHIDVDVELSVPSRYQSDAEACLDNYNAGCIVGQSLSRGIHYTSNKSINVL